MECRSRSRELPTQPASPASLIPASADPSPTSPASSASPPPPPCPLPRRASPRVSGTPLSPDRAELRKPPNESELNAPREQELNVAASLYRGVIAGALCEPQPASSLETCEPQPAISLETRLTQPPRPLQGAPPRTRRGLLTPTSSLASRSLRQKRPAPTRISTGISTRSRRKRRARRRLRRARRRLQRARRRLRGFPGGAAALRR